jgi:CRP-like cAMP-binding protein
MDAKAQGKLNSFFTKYPVRRFDKGQLLIGAGESPKGIYYMLSGHVIKYDISNRGVRLVVDWFRKGGILPIDCLSGAVDNRFFYEAFRGSTVKMAKIDEFEAFLDENPDVLRLILNGISTKLTITHRRAAHLMSGISFNLVLFELALQARMNGAWQANSEYLLDMHEDELAQRVGLTRETVNRALRRLRNMGLVEVSHKAITVKDVKAIEARLGLKL